MTTTQDTTTAPAKPKAKSTKKAAAPKAKAPANKKAATEPKTTAQGSSTEATKRDEVVLAAIKKAGKTGASKAELATGDITEDLAYLSIYRLRTQGKITKVRDGSRTPRWIMA